jgi:hypothetical protein
MRIAWTIKRTVAQLCDAWRGKAARFAAVALCFSAAAQAQPTVVGVELVLALDTSASVSRAEYQLQLQGIAEAFKDPDVMKAVEDLKPLGVAVAVMQWGGPGESSMIIPFTHIENADQAKAFGFMVGRSYRMIGATSTSIVTAIEDGVALIENNSYDGQRKVVDVSGDGQDNSGLSLPEARRIADTANIIINGLAIEEDEATLAEYYKNNVIIGIDAFVERATGFDDFARAITAKLVRELRPLGS